MSTNALHEEEEASFSAGSSGASLTYPLQMSALRKGSHVIIKGHACKISNLSTSKPGKHGHAKVNIEAYDIFTHRKFEDAGPAHAQVEVPNVTKREYQLLNVEDDGFLSLFCYEDGETKDDVKVPEGEVGGKVQRLWGARKRDLVVVVLRAMDLEMVVEIKEKSRY